MPSCGAFRHVPVKGDGKVASQQSAPPWIVAPLSGLRRAPPRGTCDRPQVQQRPGQCIKFTEDGLCGQSRPLTGGQALPQGRQLLQEGIPSGRFKTKRKEGFSASPGCGLGFPGFKCRSCLTDQDFSQQTQKGPVKKKNVKHYCHITLVFFWT